jgi:Tfp pilus assembly protein FimT
MARNEVGYSLVELIIVVIFLGVFAVVAVPRLNFATVSKQKAHALARQLVTDLRRTRSLAISDAASNTEGYELKMVGAAPYAAYEIENCGTGETVDSHTIDSKVSCTGDNKFEFGPLGNLKAGSGSGLTVSADGKSYTITIVPATGAAKCAGD